MKNVRSHKTAQTRLGQKRQGERGLTIPKFVSRNQHLYTHTYSYAEQLGSSTK